MSTGRTIAWNRDLFLLLKKAQEEAAAAAKRDFMLDLGKGQEVQLDTRYAKYLIEFLAGDFAQPDQPRRPYNEGEEGQ